MHLDRPEYERRYMTSLRFEMTQGISTTKYDIELDGVEFYAAALRSWGYVRFHVAGMPGCVFARAGLIWCGHTTDDDPSWMAQLFDVHLLEILEARGWGLPPRCEPGQVTWLHPYRSAPWETDPKEEPERRDWERRFLTRMQELLHGSMLNGVSVDRLELRDKGGKTHALLAVQVPDRADCTFVNHWPVWVGWPTAISPETRADEFLDVVVRWLADLPAHCEPQGLTWGGRAPQWFESSRPR